MRYGPYKGAARTYQVEDSEFLFGRDRDTERLIARILSSRVTLLYASSGAGKTSMLNAKVIPGLEDVGWVVIRRTFDDDPVESLRVGMIGSLIPPMSAESEAVSMAASALDLTGSSTIQDLLTSYEKLEAKHPLKRKLVSMLDTRDLDYPQSLPRESIMPWFRRLLRGAAGLEEFVDHLRAIAGSDGPMLEKVWEIDGSTRLDSLQETLMALDSAHEALVEWILQKDPGLHSNESLVRVVERLYQRYGHLRRGLRLVLVMDQFEELFTRFIDLGQRASKAEKKEVLDWHLRHDFLSALEKLYERCQRSGNSLGERGEWTPPLRFVVSIREDYLGQLDSIRRFVSDLDESGYRLAVLDVGQASAAIREPAKIYGFEYSDDCYQLIIDELTKEDRFVEPGVLQMVCSRLWEVKVREVAEAPLSNQGARVISREVFDDAVRGVEGIVDDFITKALAPLSPGDRREALDMLQMLITTQRTRNIVEVNQVLRAAFRFRKRRDKLLRHLEEQGVVRIESRLGGRFVEINHELLIDSVFKVYRDETASDVDDVRFRRSALAALGRAAEVDSLPAAAKLISETEFKAANDFRSEINFRWKNPRTELRPGPELMYRSALSNCSDSETIERWADILDASSQVEGGVSIPDWEPQHSILSRQQWQLACTDPVVLELDGGQLETMYRSTLQHSRAANRGRVAYWARKVDGNE